MQYFWNIIGHERKLAMLEHDIENDNISHAYLFSGPEKIGKWKIAKKFAKILQCGQGACGECQNCKLAAHDSHPDIFLYHSSDPHIPIKFVRSLQEKVYRSKQSPYNIIIIENIERMLIPAQNAFLKILEEPPEGTVFILTTSNISSLLSTIISRVRIVNFYPLEKNILHDFLKEKSSESEERIHDILAFSHGRIGFALDLLRDFDLFQQRKIMVDSIQNLLEKGNGVHMFAYIHQVSNDDVLISHFLESFLGVLRNFLLRKVKGEQVALPFSKIVLLIDKIEDTKRGLKANINRKLLFENLLLAVE